MRFEKKNSARNLRIFALALASMLVGSALTYWGISQGVKGRASLVYAESPLAAAPAQAKAAIAGAESVQEAFRYVADAVTPSVVELDVVEKVQQSPQPELPDDFPWKFFFNQPDGRSQKPRSYTQQGLGSGIIVRQSGKTVYVLTNAHVAGQAVEISVTTNDQKKYKGTLVGKDEKRDIALVKFSAEGDKGFSVASLGDSSSVRVGDWAIAIGNPYGFVSSVTAGIVSAVHRSGGPEGNINDFIQTDASINPGNSGGALVNIRGEVVGINTWIASQSGGNIGLGFAIPIDNVKKAIDDFISKGKVEYGWLGIGLDAPDEATAKELSADAKGAVMASSVVKSSPAQKGGILPGDLIRSVNGQAVSGVEQVQRLVAELPVGKQVELEVLRQGRSLSLRVGIEVRDEKQSADGKAYSPGLVLRSLKFDQIDQDALPKGVRGVFVAGVAEKSPAAVLGVKEQDIITAVNEKAVSSVGEFYSALNDPKSSKVSFTIYREGQSLSTAAYSK
jgi:Do/DeqQ family serine protease